MATDARQNACSCEQGPRTLRALLTATLLSLATVTTGTAQGPASPEASGQPRPQASPAAPSGLDQPGPPAKLREARERARRAAGLFEVGNFGSALLEFERAHGLLQGHPRRPELLYNMALCLRALFRYGEALALFERYLVESSVTGERRAEVQRAVQALARLVAELRVESNLDAEVWIEGRRRGETPLTLRIAGGSYTLEVRRPGSSSVRRPLELSAGDRRLERVDFQPSDPGLDRHWVWTGCGIAGALALTGAALWTATALRHARMLDRDPARVTSEDNRRQARMALAGDLLLTGAGGAALGTAALALFVQWQRDEAQEAATEDTLSVDVGVGLDPTRPGLWLGGRF